MASSLPSYPEAALLVAQRASAFVRIVRTERITLADAFARVLAEPVRADRDMPAFPRSTRDGYACRVAELSANSTLPIAGSTRAGQSNSVAIPPGAAWEIMTGAAVPAGADAVVMLEHVDHLDRAIRLHAERSIEHGENIVPAGAEAHAGDELIPVGTRLSASHIAAAATCGYAALNVFARPRVAILTTGDELVAVDATPGPAQIRNSNASMLAALVTQHGGEPWILPAARDIAEEIEASLRTAQQADMLLISGGVSAGKFDLVEPVLEKLGAQFHFTGVRIQPGKPLVFGELPGAKPFFGLPGNPISSAATFSLFGVPVLNVLCGRTEPRPHFISAQLTRAVKGKPSLTRFVPSLCTYPAQPGRLPQVAAIPWQGSGDLAAFARANCFLVVPEGVESIAPETTVSILPF